MASWIEWFATKRVGVLILAIGLASAVLAIAACGGKSEAGNPSPDGKSIGAPPSSGTTVTGGSPGAVVPVAPGGQAVPTTRAQPSGIALGEGRGSAPTFSPAYQNNVGQQVGIWVSGQGTVVSTPDLAILSAGVEARAETVERARSQAAQAMGQIVQALNARGIKSGDIHTQYFNISPEYVWNDGRKRQELVGYIVSNQMSVKIRDVGSAGVVIDQVAAAGGDLVRIQGVSFTREDTGAVEVQARELAAKQMVAKAQQYAELTGVKLGKLVYLTESGGFIPRIESYGFKEELAGRAALAEVPTPISGGELTVTVFVQGVFSIE